MAGKVHTKRFDRRVFVPVNNGSDITTLAGYDNWLRGLKEDPARAAAVLVDLRRPAGVNRNHYGVAAFKGGREPMLNADKRAVERSLSRHFDEHGSKHAKLKCFKIIEVKPESPQAAKVNGNSWSQHQWEVWTLRYSPGLVLRNHRGDESDVFPGWGKMKSTLEEIGFKIIK